MKIGLSVLIGAGTTAAILLLLDILRIPWSRTVFLLVAAAFVLVWWWLRRPRWQPLGNQPLSALIVNSVTAGMVLLHGFYGMRSTLWDWADWITFRRDFFFIWGYKARLFFFERGIPWDFLRRLPNDFTHPDYPLLLPLLFDVPSVLTASWRPQLFAWIDAALGAALLMTAYRCLRDELPPTAAALGTLALSGSALLPWVGNADGPLVAFAASGTLLIRRMLRGYSESLLSAGVLLSFAAMTKNEGIAFFFALCLVCPMLIRRLWPVVAVIGAWMAARIALHLPTDVFTGPLLPRIQHNLALFPSAFANVPMYQPLVLIASLIAIALSPIENFRRERLLLLVAPLQLCFYLGVYALTPHDVRGHVNGSWDRISSHVTMLVAFAGLTSIGRALELNPRSPSVTLGLAE